MMRDAKALLPFTAPIPEGHGDHEMRPRLFPLIPRDLQRNVRDETARSPDEEPLLPREIVHRKKKGFGMPVASWLNGPLREIVNDTFAKDAIDRAGLFNHAEIRRMLDAHAARKTDYRKPLWTLLVFELWRREYLS